MTALLRKAVAEVERLTADQQDAIAARWLAEVEDERAWSAHFAATTDAQWDAMANEARREIAAGRTSLIEASFPGGESDE